MLACAMLLPGSIASAASFTAKLDRTSVSVGESVTLSLVFSDDSPDQRPELPEIPGLRYGGVSASQNFTIVNGKASAQVKYDFMIIPTKEGEYTIPALTYRVGGKNLTSQPLKLTVTKTPVSSATNPDGTPAEAFVQLVIPKSEIYLGETVPAEVRLYFQHVRDVQLPEVSAEGFTITPFDQRPEQSQVQMNGQIYNLAVFRLAISPAKTGTLKLGPARCNLVILSEPRRDFFGTSFARSRRATLASEEVVIRALPLPGENKPTPFSGSIGQFDMQVSASPTELSVGDPITVRVEISGRGALESLQLPHQPGWNEFKTYAPSSQVDSSDPHGLEGTKIFELVVSPQNAAIRELPPFEFSYFDPETKSYKTLRSEAIPLKVRPSALTPQPTVVSTGNTESLDPVEAREIVHIKPHLGTVTRSASPWIAQPAFWIIQAAAPALWLVALLCRRRKESLDRNPRLRRQKEADRIIQQNLEKLRKYAEANQSDDFFSTVMRLLQERIGERLDLPPSAITEAVVETELKPRGLSDNAASLLHQLFQTCNQARYAPVRGSHELASHIPKVEQALLELKNLKNEPVAVAR